MPDAPVRDSVYWFAHREPALAPLTGTQSADVAVVGGGMMGLICARALASAGRSVCLIEANTCGGEASGRSSGFITPDSELELADLEAQFGAEEARRLWEFARGGVETIRDAIRTHRIDCDYQDQDALFVATKSRSAKTPRHEHATRQKLGFASVHYTRETLPTALGGVGYHGAVSFGGTFGIDAYRCCAGLRRALLDAGVRIFEGSAVTRLRADGIETGVGAIRARHVAVCTDRFLPALGLAPREIYHAQTFLAISEPLSPADAKRMFPDRPLMVWDTDLLYRYFRLSGDRRLLIGGSTLLATYARHEIHQPQKVARQLTGYLQRHFPDINVTLAAIWPGLIGISKDFAAVVGRSPRDHNVHFAGGAAGLPWAAALGGYLAEKILRGRDDFDQTLSVDRKFPVGRRLQSLIGTPTAFALAHGITKFVG